MQIDDYLARWNLTPDGDPIRTPTSDLLPVRYQGGPAMLKIARVAEERWGASLMVWWNGAGAARVLKHEGDALLMERALGKNSVAAMARNGQDDQASRIICSVAATLHAPKPQPLPDLIPLARWFDDLITGAHRYGGILTQSARTAQYLLSNPQDIVVLHGDLHHGNILDGGVRGWLAIDPKRLIGERGFELANLFCNPDQDVATAPGRLARQASVVALAAGLDRKRLLQWVIAWAGLSAIWLLQDEVSPHLPLTIATLAGLELSASGQQS